MFELRSTSYDLSKPLAAMAKRAKQDGFEFYYTRHIDEDVFELELRRCAAEAMQAPEMEVSDIDGSKDAAEVDKEFRKQQLNFLKRVRAQTLGRIAATTQPVNVLAEQGVQDKVQEIMQQVSQQSFERRRRR